MTENQAQQCSIMTYEGDPDYVRVGFWVDLLDRWVEIEGSEWGDQLCAMHRCATAFISVSNLERAAMVVDWIKSDLMDAFEQDWWDQRDYYLGGIRIAQDETQETIDHWRERAVSFKGEVALELEIDNLPKWMWPAQSPRDQLAEQIIVQRNELDAQNAKLDRLRGTLERLESALEALPE